MLSLGLDIGYSSVKLVLIDTNNTVLHHCYALHRGDIRGALRTVMNDLSTQDPEKMIVGIPRALFTYGMFPMFNALFRELGLNVLLSRPTSEETIRAGQEFAMDETYYPLKLINEHVAALARKKVDDIFFPAGRKSICHHFKNLRCRGPGAQHGDTLQDYGYGYRVVPFFALPEGDISGTHPNMYWPFGQHILQAAQLIKAHPNLYAVFLSHHGCGPDSVMSHYVKEILQEKPYLHVEVDEHASDIGVITRLEAFVNSLKKRTVETAGPMDSYLKKAVLKKARIDTHLTELTT